MDESTRKTTAFVLAGGGSFGAVQVGMLRALVAHGLRPDLVVGSSVGAINGAYFAGAPHARGVAQLEAIWRSLDRREVFPLAWRDVFGVVGGRRSYAIDPTGLRRLCERCLPYQRLEQARVPLHVVATDLLGGGTVRLSEGPAVDAIMASSAIPVVFPPVRLAGRYLIDGAITGNTPISAAVALGAQRVIVLPTGFACMLDAPPASAVASALHAVTLLIAHQLALEFERHREQAEIITVPPLCPLTTSPYDFSRAGELIERAAEQTQRWLARGGLMRQRVPRALMAHIH